MSSDFEVEPLTDEQAREWEETDRDRHRTNVRNWAQNPLTQSEIRKLQKAMYEQHERETQTRKWIEQEQQSRDIKHERDRKWYEHNSRCGYGFAYEPNIDPEQFYRMMSGMDDQRRYEPPPPEEWETAAAPERPGDSMIGQEGRRKVSVFLREGPADGELEEQWTNDAGVPPMRIRVTWTDPETGQTTPGGLVIPVYLIYELCPEQPSPNAFEYEYKHTESDNEINNAISRGLNTPSVDQLIVDEADWNAAKRSKKAGSFLWPPPRQEQEYEKRSPLERAGWTQKDIDALAELNRLGAKMRRDRFDPSGRQIQFGVSLTEEEAQEALDHLRRQLGE